MIRRLIREPLAHFLLLAGLIFAAYGLLSGRVATEEAIDVTPAKVEQMASIFAGTRLRPPTADELKVLIDDYGKRRLRPIGYPPFAFTAEERVSS